MKWGNIWYVENIPKLRPAHLMSISDIRLFILERKRLWHWRILKPTYFSHWRLTKSGKTFIFAHCTTCHSAQGSSVDDEITLFDCNHFLVRNYKEWLWAAITRCRDLNKVKFFKYNKDTNDEFNQKTIMNYFERKNELQRTGQDSQKKNTKRWLCKCSMVFG